MIGMRLSKTRGEFMPEQLFERFISEENRYITCLEITFDLLGNISIGMEDNHRNFISGILKQISDELNPLYNKLKNSEEK